MNKAWGFAVRSDWPTEGPTNALSQIEQGTILRLIEVNAFKPKTRPRPVRTEAEVDLPFLKPQQLSTIP